MGKGWEKDGNIIEAIAIAARAQLQHSLDRTIKGQ
jgi:hypothetical protein